MFLVAEVDKGCFFWLEAGSEVSITGTCRNINVGAQITIKSMHVEVLVLLAFTQWTIWPLYLLGSMYLALAMAVTV